MIERIRFWTLLIATGLIVGCASAQFKKEREEANQSVQALRALQSVVSVGIEPTDYSKRLQDCKIIVDHTLQGSSEPKLAPVKESIAAAMDSYEKANKVFQERPYDGDQISGIDFLEDESLESDIERQLEESKDVVDVGLSEKKRLYPKKKVVPLIWALAQKQTDLAAEKLAKL